MAAKRKNVRSKAVTKAGNTLPAPLADFDDAVASSARQDAAIRGGGSNFMSTRNGVLSFDGNEVGDDFPCVIIGYAYENAYYEGAFDPTNMRPPSCFAISEDGDNMMPPASLDTAQSGECAGCWANAFGSASAGKGKACKNQMRLGILPWNADASDLMKAQTAILRVSPTSVKNFATYVRSVANVLNRGVEFVVTHINLVDDPKTQFKMEFAVAEQITDAQLGAVIVARKAEMAPALTQLPEAQASDDNTQAQPATRTVARKVVRKKATRIPRKR